MSDEEKNEISSGNDSDCECEDADGGFAAIRMESSKDLQYHVKRVATSQSFTSGFSSIV
jgi:hypothetical protein